MSVVRYYFDEDCQSGALAAALRQHGVEVQTTNEAGTSGVGDDAQLQHATDAGFVLVTNNIGDFTALHDRWLAAGRHHAGIVLFAQQAFSIGEIVRRLAHLRRTLTAEQMRDRLEWLTAWGSR